MANKKRGKAGRTLFGGVVVWLVLFGVLGFCGVGAQRERMEAGSAQRGTGGGEVGVLA